MIRKLNLLFCDNEHGIGNVTFPDLKALDDHDIQEAAIEGATIGALRRAAAKEGWGRVDGCDFCPLCMESQK